MSVLAELTTFNGLPAHPLIVHLPVMLVPLALIGAIAALARPGWRPWALPLTALGATGSLLGVQLAMMSGEGLEELSGEKEALIERHSQLAEQARPIVFLFFLCAVGAAIAYRMAHQEGNARKAQFAKALVPLMALSVLTGVLSTAWVYRTGHTGAESVWKDEGKGEKGEKSEREGTSGGDEAPAPSGDEDGD